MNMTPIPFFTDDLTLVAHSASTGLEDLLDRPVTVAEFTQRTGNNPISVFETEDGELILETHTRYNLNGGMVFLQGPAGERALERACPKCPHDMGIHCPQCWPDAATAA